MVIGHLGLVYVALRYPTCLLSLHNFRKDHSIDCIESIFVITISVVARGRVELQQVEYEANASAAAICTISGKAAATIQNSFSVLIVPLAILFVRQTFVCLLHRPELILIASLVWMVHERQFSVGLLDGGRVGITFNAQHLVVTTDLPLFLRHDRYKRCLYLRR